MNEGHWAAVSRAYLKDLHLLTEAALRGDDSPHPSGSVQEAADRLEILIGMLPQLDQESAACDAEVRHGPGHQSRTKCELTGRHEIHRAVYMGTEATWRGPYEYTGAFDEPPSAE